MQILTKRQRILYLIFLSSSLIGLAYAETGGEAALREVKAQRGAREARAAVEFYDHMVRAERSLDPNNPPSGFSIENYLSFVSEAVKEKRLKALSDNSKVLSAAMNDMSSSVSPSEVPGAKKAYTRNVLLTLLDSQASHEVLAALPQTLKNFSAKQETASNGQRSIYTAHLGRVLDVLSERFSMREVFFYLDPTDNEQRKIMFAMIENSYVNACQPASFEAHDTRQTIAQKVYSMATRQTAVTKDAARYYTQIYEKLQGHAYDRGICLIADENSNVRIQERAAMQTPGKAVSGDRNASQSTRSPSDHVPGEMNHFQ
jgi:hypothetical protein